MIVTLWELAGGRVSLHGALMLILLASEFFIPLRLLGSFFHIAMNGMAASDRIFALLDLPEPEKGEEILAGGETNLCFDHVCFSYGEDRQILDQVSMEFPAGSFTSIVGASGCGKSTAAGILMGRNRGYGGSVRIQGKELSHIREESLMEQITMVSHNSWLFKGTVEDNLRMGAPDAGPKEMEEALRKANLWDFLAGQQGLQTPVLEKGSNFSGGQCQRLALARALLHDTPVYIFDEATSNIDAESEEMIMDVIRRLAGQKTVILISHRLANVTGSDRIYMMQDGRVAESGTHRQLLERRGQYEKLYRTQMELEQYGKEAAV